MEQNTGRRLAEKEGRRVSIRSWSIVLLIVGLMAVVSAANPKFLTLNNLHSIFYGVSFNYFAIIGFTFLIIMGELDMSVGSLYGFGGAMMGLFVFTYKLPAPAAILLAVLFAAAVGYLTGMLVTNFRVNSMMVTIGVMMAVKGLNWMLVNRFSGRQLPLAARQFISGDVLGLKWTIILMVLSAVLLEFLLHKSRFFKQMYAIGDNGATAALYGVKTNAVKRACFSASAALSAFGGALTTARIAHPDVTVGGNLEISIITAAVISGASIFGGRGSVLRSMLGVVFMYMLQNAMTSFGINSYIQQIVLGAILIAAIYLDLRINADNA